MQEPDQDLPEGLTSGVTGLDDVLQPPRSRRAALLRFGATALALMAAVALMLHFIAPGSLVFPNFRHSSAQTSGRTTTTTTIPITTAETPVQQRPTLQAITLQTNVNFGLSLNGQPLTQKSGGNTIPVLMGKNTLAFKALPFIPLSCSFVWPLPKSQDGGAPCSLVGIGDNDTGLVPVVNFVIPLQNIPPALKQSLDEVVRQQVTQAATDLSVAIPVGDYIPYTIDGNGVPQSRATTQPLVGHVSLNLQSMQTNTICDNILCPGQISPTEDTAEKVFSFFLSPQLGWRFTDATNQVVDAVTIETMHTNGVIQTYVSFDANTSWHVSNSLFQGNLTAEQMVQQQIIGNFCNIANDELADIIRASNITQGFGGNSQGDSLQGCSLHIQSDSKDYGTFISRFGALLAVDAPAHQLAPSLPIASPDEVTAVAAG